MLSGQKGARCSDSECSGNVFEHLSWKSWEHLGLSESSQEGRDFSLIEGHFHPPGLPNLKAMTDIQSLAEERTRDKEKRQKQGRLAKVL